MFKELLLIVLVAETAVSVPVKRDNAKDGLVKKDCVLLFKGNQEKAGSSVESSSLSENDIVEDVDWSTETDCKVVIVEESDKTTDEKTEQSTTDHVQDAEEQVDLIEDKRLSPLSCPMYEQQQAAWPTDADDVVDVSQSAGQLHTTIPAWTQQISTSNGVQLHEDQIVVYPEAYGEGDKDKADKVMSPVVPKPSDVQVLENYQVVHPNGTIEYKLSLSNGLVVYKKIYKKIGSNGKEIVVQEGYYSVPIPGKKNEFLTQFYIADEKGYNVYKVEYNRGRPSFPIFLKYKNQITAKENKL